MLRLSAIIPTTLFLSAAAFPADIAPQYGVNLVQNGHFELGKDWQPASWSRLDRLTSFWNEAVPGKKNINPDSVVKSGEQIPSGRYLLIDTDVLLSQYQERQEELDKNPNAGPPVKIPVKPPGYDSVGGTYGVAVRSDPIPIEQDAYYNISAWCKGVWQKNADGDFMPMVFVKGYSTHGPSGREQEVTRKYLACRADADKGWQFFTWSRPYAPSKLRKDVKVEYVRLVVFCYWPRHEYAFDDIRFFRVPEPPDSEKSPLEKDPEGKHGTAVNPDDDKDWLPPPAEKQPPKDQPDVKPEDYDALKGLIDVKPVDQ